MESEILKIITEYGIFAVLFFFLLIVIIRLFMYLLKRAETREDKLLQHIKKSDEHIENSDRMQEKLTDKIEQIGNTLTGIQTNMLIMQHDIDDLKDRV